MSEAFAAIEKIRLQPSGFFVNGQTIKDLESFDDEDKMLALLEERPELVNVGLVSKFPNVVKKAKLLLEKNNE